MDDFSLRKELDYLAQHDHGFMLHDLFSFAEASQSISSKPCEQVVDTFLSIIASDPRFLTVHEEATGEPIFISKKALTIWYINLNISLAKSNISRLRANTLGQLVSSLLEFRALLAIPKGFVVFGEGLSLITQAIVGDAYIFPFWYRMDKTYTKVGVK